MNNSDIWVDSYEVCTALKIGRRTLQRLRAHSIVNYSLICGKIMYEITEIQRLLDENVIQCSDECMQELIKNHTLHAEQRRNTPTDE
ncbi:MAG: DNA-binding protein [Bacteroidales bacterium]|nr:DNA-binding protein [Bacteroidales bacterium]